jgi:hypothetical protein
VKRLDFNLKKIFLFPKDLISAAKRDRIQEQTKTALTNIQKNKQIRLNQLDIDYKSWDKAKTSFGYIGITFFTCLFGSIFVNDLVKVFIHYFAHLRAWYRRSISKKKDEKIDETRVIVEMNQAYDDELIEERLEKVYFKLVEARAKRKN